jgi:hypothetical protein
MEEGEFAKIFAEAKAREKKLDELRVAVIKWHLLVEGALDDFLTLAFFNPQHLKLDRMNFHLKGNLALALSLKGDTDPFWGVLWALNLRNKIAHNVEPKEVDEKMKYLRKTYIEALEPSQRADAEKKADNQVVEDASILVIGFIGNIAMGTYGRRAAERAVER